MYGYCAAYGDSGCDQVVPFLPAVFTSRFLDAFLAAGEAPGEVDFLSPAGDLGSAFILGELIPTAMYLCQVYLHFLFLDTDCLDLGTL